MADEPAGTYERIAAACGDDAARRLCRAYGGRPIYLPCRLPADHHLARLLGFDAATRLCVAFGHGRLDVPFGPDARDLGARVARLTADGHSAPEIARRLGCTVRTVHRWRARVCP